MNDKRELIENVKSWIDIDNDIKTLQKELKKKKKRKKNIHPKFSRNYENK